MDDETRALDAAAERDLDNMFDCVISTRAIAELAEAEVWRLMTSPGVGDDAEEQKFVEASAELTVSLGMYGEQVARMLGCGVLLQDIAELTDVDVDELRLAVSFAP